MPGLNRRGPNGEGAMTGRKLGHCNPENKGKTDDEISQNRATLIQTGQGMGMGRGRGKGLGLGGGLGLRFRGNR
jgi:hypothetical protein